MTWAEFCIRSHAYERIEKNEWRKVREIAYNTLIAPNYDPKKLPRTKNDFMPIDQKEKSSPTEFMLKVMKKAKERYRNELKGKKQ